MTEGRNTDLETSQSSGVLAQLQRLQACTVGDVKVSIVGQTPLGGDPPTLAAGTPLHQQALATING